MTKRTGFGSKLGIILATAGSAVGLGNIWRFPYMTGEYGGAVFIIIYILCVLLLGLPCLLGEFVIGRAAQANTARAYRRLGGRTPLALIGYMGVLTGFLIAGYYAVVSGWCLQYIFTTLAGTLSGVSSAAVTAYFSEFSSSWWQPVVTAAAILLLTHLVIIRGVRAGIERASKLMMPTLFAILILLVVASVLTPGGTDGIVFLFKPDFSAVSRDMFLGALGQSFYSLSIGMGCLCTFASYFHRDVNLPRSAVQIATIDTLIAILAGLMIFPVAFAVGVRPDSGPSLIFITLPNVFNAAFGSVPLLGTVVALLFYSLLTLAALTSLISIHEVITAFVSEEFGRSRACAASVVTGGCTLLAVLSSLSLGAVGGLSAWGKSLFDIFDFTTGQILLPLGGFFTCLLLGWYVPRSVSFAEFTNRGTICHRLFPLWLFAVRYVCPVGIALVFLNQLGVI